MFGDHYQNIKTLF